MKSFSLILGLLFSITAFASGDLAEFGVRQTGSDAQKERFEALIADRIAKRLEQYIEQKKFQVTVKTSLSEPKKIRTGSSKNIQLGMLGTVVNLKPPRHSSRDARFIHRVKQLKLTLYFDSSITKKTEETLMSFAKEEVSFLPDDIIVAEVKPLQIDRGISFDFIKDFQILFASVFLAAVLLFGMKNMTEQLKVPFADMSAATAVLASSRPQVELIPGQLDYQNEANEFYETLSEDDFFKLPIAVQQAVVGFSSFSIMQEVYTLLSPKYKKLFWSCLPQEYQHMPEKELIKQACIITDVESSRAWKHLCSEVHRYVSRNSDIYSNLHPDILHYFSKAGGKDDKKAS